MQNAKCKMQNDCVGFADYLNHFQRKYLNFAFFILNSALKKPHRSVRFFK